MFPKSLHPQGSPYSPSKRTTITDNSTVGSNCKEIFSDANSEEGYNKVHIVQKLFSSQSIEKKCNIADGKSSDLTSEVKLEYYTDNTSNSLDRKSYTSADSSKATADKIANPIQDKSNILKNLISSNYQENVKTLCDLSKYLEAKSLGGNLNSELDSINEDKIQEYDFLFKQNGTVPKSITRSMAFGLIGLCIAIRPDLITVDKSIKLNHELVKLFLNLVVGNVNDSMMKQIINYAKGMQVQSDLSGYKLCVSNGLGKSKYELFIPKKTTENLLSDDDKLTEMIEENFNAHELIFDDLSEVKLHLLFPDNPRLFNKLKPFIGTSTRAKNEAKNLKEQFSTKNFDSKNEAIGERIKHTNNQRKNEELNKEESLASNKFMEIREFEIPTAHNEGALVRKYKQNFNESGLQVVNGNNFAAKILNSDGTVKYTQSATFVGAIFAGERVSDAETEADRNLQKAEHLANEFGAVFDALQIKKDGLVIDARYLSFSSAGELFQKASKKITESDIFHEHSAAGYAAADSRRINYCCFAVNVGNDLQVFPKHEEIKEITTLAIENLCKFVNSKFGNDGQVQLVLKKIQDLNFSDRKTAITFFYWLQELKKLIPTIQIIMGCKSAKDRTTAIAVGSYILSQLVENRIDTYNFTSELDKLFKKLSGKLFDLIDENGRLNAKVLTWREKGLVTRMCRDCLPSLWYVNQKTGLISTNINSCALTDFLKGCNFIKNEYRTYALTNNMII